jgi:sugar O-acyltransferase (sialic acid O-acetyltransferase NeuD family)
MPDILGLLGDGAQAREVAAFAHPAIISFRAVDSAYLDGHEGLIDIATEDPRLLAIPVVSAVGAPALRRKLVGVWRGTEFVTVVASSAWVADDVELGDGCVIAPQAVVSVGSRIGAHSIVNLGATVSHDARIGEFVTLGPGAHVAGNCTLGDGVVIGVGATVSNRVSIAAGAVVGAGAVVVRDIVEPGVYIGVPAQLTRTLEDWLHDL